MQRTVSWAPAFGSFTEEDHPGRPVVQTGSGAGGEEECRYFVDFQPSRVYSVEGRAGPALVRVACVPGFGLSQAVVEIDHRRRRYCALGKTSPLEFEKRATALRRAGFPSVRRPIAGDWLGTVACQGTGFVCDKEFPFGEYRLGELAAGGGQGGEEGAAGGVVQGHARFAGG